MSVGMHFECCGSLLASDPILIFSLGIYIYLGHQNFDGQDPTLEEPSNVQILVDLGTIQFYL